ncbi:MAG: GNAT family N-acetyltransferase [Chloroflexi bacterium]|nr:MAG: GNAT family N-acetyltransferase [Chloroflexota bacterium]
MLEKIINGGFWCSLTDTREDEALRRFLSRKMLESYQQATSPCLPSGIPLDITIHDHDEEIIAGLSAVMCDGVVYAPLVWIHPHYDGHALVQALLDIVEDYAREHGCFKVEVQVPWNIAPYFGYVGEAPSNIVPFKAAQNTQKLWHKDLA